RRHIVLDLNARADFVCQQVSSLELVAAVDVSLSCQRRRISRASRRNDGGYQLQASFGQGRRSHCTRNRGPNRLVRSYVPKNSSVRFDFQASKVVVLQLGPESELPAPVEQADFVLSEPAELVQLTMAGLQRHGKAGVVIVANRAVSNSPDDGL